MEINKKSLTEKDQQKEKFLDQLSDSMNLCMKFINMYDDKDFW